MSNIPDMVYSIGVINFKAIERTIRQIVLSRFSSTGPVRFPNGKKSTILLYFVIIT